MRQIWRQRFHSAFWAEESSRDCWLDKHVCVQIYLPTSRGSAYKRSVIPHLRQIFCRQKKDRAHCYHLYSLMHMEAVRHLILRLPRLLIWLLKAECYTLSFIRWSNTGYTPYIHLLSGVICSAQEMVFANMSSRRRKTWWHTVFDHRSTGGKQAGLATACLDHSCGTPWRIIGH